MTDWALPNGRADGRRGEGGGAGYGNLFADIERSVKIRGESQPGSLSPALFHGELSRKIAPNAADMLPIFHITTHNVKVVLPESRNVTHRNLPLFLEPEGIQGKCRVQSVTDPVPRREKADESQL